MERKRQHTVLLAAIASVFALALTWAAVELPTAINSLLQGSLPSPSFEPGIQPPGETGWLTPVRVIHAP